MDPIEQALHRTLVVRCQLGDREALDELFLRHHRALAYYLRRLCDVRNDTDVADIQQDVWLTVIRRIGQLRNPDSFVVWLYQIARRKALARVAELRRLLTVERDGADSPIAEGDEFSAEDAARIHQELAALGPAHREVLLLRFMEDLSYEQIAEVIGCSPGTVRSRLHYAKLALRQRLEREQ